MIVRKQAVINGYRTLKLMILRSETALFNKHCLNAVLIAMSDDTFRSDKKGKLCLKSLLRTLRLKLKS